METRFNKKRVWIILECRKVLYQSRKFSHHKWMKKRKGLYYHCDEKWNPTHKCKNPNVYLLQVSQEVSDSFMVNEDELCLREEEGHADVGQEEGEESVEVSIHAISGCSANNAMKLHGRIGAYALEILVDSRNTHNF